MTNIPTIPTIPTVPNTPTSAPNRMAAVALPRLRIEADGVELSLKARQALAELRVQQRLSLPTQCELTFANPVNPSNPSDSPMVDQILSPGVGLRISVQDQSAPLFVGQVTALEYVYGPAHGAQLRVRGYDVLHSLRKRQNVRTHVQVTLADLARELVSDLALAVQADDDGPFWPSLFQYDETDFDILAKTAARYGLYLTLREDTLHLITLRGFGDAVPLALGGTLFEAQFEVNGDPACRSVSAIGWDLLKVEVHQSSVSTARVGREVTAEVPPATLNGTGKRTLVDEAMPDDRHVEGAAQAELDRRVAREVTLTGVAEGNPDLQPGSIVDVSGVADSIRGRYVLTSVNHVVDGQVGYVSEITTVPPVPPEYPRSAVATLGIVTQVDDPDSLGRVRVSLPTYNNVETEWIGVLSLGAGSGKGLIILPGVGDQVLILMTHEDPAQAVVLGGLYGVHGAPDPGIQDRAVQRFTLLSPGGQRITLDDPKRLIRLQNRDGSLIEIAPGTVRLRANANLQIEAPGHRIVIRGGEINFEHG